VALADEPSIDEDEYAPLPFFDDEGDESEERPDDCMGTDDAESPDPFAPPRLNDAMIPASISKSYSSATSILLLDSPAFNDDVEEDPSRLSAEALVLGDWRSSSWSAKAARPASPSAKDDEALLGVSKEIWKACEIAETKDTILSDLPALSTFTNTSTSSLVMATSVIRGLVSLHRRGNSPSRFLPKFDVTRICFPLDPFVRGDDSVDVLAIEVGSERADAVLRVNRGLLERSKVPWAVPESNSESESALGDPISAALARALR
jgi:hypothetical protein